MSQGMSSNELSTHEYAVRALVIGPEMTSSFLERSARAARGNPQLATYKQI